MKFGKENQSLQNTDNQLELNRRIEAVPSVLEAQIDQTSQRAGRNLLIGTVTIMPFWGSVIGAVNSNMEPSIVVLAGCLGATMGVSMVEGVRNIYKSVNLHNRYLDLISKPDEQDVNFQTVLPILPDVSLPGIRQLIEMLANPQTSFEDRSRIRSFLGETNQLIGKTLDVFRPSQGRARPQEEPSIGEGPKRRSRLVSKSPE